MTEAETRRPAIVLWAALLLVSVGRLVRLGFAPLATRSDFLLYVLDGRAVRAGANPYVVDARTIPAMAGYAPSLSAPASMLYAALLSLPDPAVAERVLIVLSTLAFIPIVLILLRHIPPAHRLLAAAWLLNLDCFWTTLASGQIYVFLALASIGAWALIERRPLAAGILIGIVVAIKPNLLLWPTLLLLVGSFAPAIAAFASAGALSLLAAVLFGPAIYLEWVHAALSQTMWVVLENAALPAVVAHLGLPGLGTATTVVIVAVAAVLTRWRRPTPRRLSELAPLVAVAAAPIAWPSYIILALPAVLEARPAWLRGLVAILMLLPLGYLIMLFPEPTAGLVIAIVGPAIYVLVLLGALPPGWQSAAARRFALTRSATPPAFRARETNSL